MARSGFGNLPRLGPRPTSMLFTLLLALAAGPAAAPAPAAQAPGAGDVVPGQLIVRFGAGARARRDAILGEGYRIARVLAPDQDLWLVEITGEDTVPAACRALGARRGVLYAVPDHVLEFRDTVPDDPAFTDQYGKDNRGQTGGVVDADIDAPEAWDHGTGSPDFAVAIVDDGTEHGHPDLVDNRFENALEIAGLPGVDDDGNGYVDDLYGWDVLTDTGDIVGMDHGTHVTGIAAARGDNGIGVAGVSWSSTFVPITGAIPQTSTAVAAYAYALKLRQDFVQSGGTRGANVVAVNTSFGMNFADCTDPQFAPWNDMFDALGAEGILSVAATMNNPSDVDLVGDVPTSCTSDHLITVTALDASDARNFAAFGSFSIDVGAAGQAVFSTETNGTYDFRTGTSMAAPEVTGAIALLHSVAGPGFAARRDADPAAAALELKSILLANVDPVADLLGQSVSGGRLNLKKAADAVVGGLAGVTSFCDPNVINSTGFVPRLTASGSLQASSNAFTLEAFNIPAGRLVLFLASRAEAAPVSPASSQGDLCLGGQIGRLMEDLATAAPDGRASVSPDLTRIPQFMGLETVMAGETWRFQAWHPDTILFSNTSYFTTAIRVDFQ